ncbi:hypothetical protein EVAR_36877_1 [Eumeta japonica]|uniref:Uncharacterized protein n=1 Tax=Eumeta variegata TaxID=151549 RepID=A0A4C1WVB9_EUMVA|nr:hypothetical protein EVAR_36877_1 [Eumeta japonica]
MHKTWLQSSEASMDASFGRVRAAHGCRVAVMRAMSAAAGRRRGRRGGAPPLAPLSIAPVESGPEVMIEWDATTGRADRYAAGRGSSATTALHKYCSR